MRVPPAVVPFRRCLGSLTFLALFMVCAISAYGSIAGSKHDFSGKGWGSTEICIFCHTPHNANRTVTDAPLWNHQISGATQYTVYSSPTLSISPQQPKGPTRLCLSCHDGTIAIDSFGGKTGTSFITGRANLGTDLSNDHPVSVAWTHNATDYPDSNCQSCHAGFFGSGAEYSSVLPFYGPINWNWGEQQSVECFTCHEPHNKYPANTKMLRLSMNGSELCLYCHAK